MPSVARTPKEQTSPPAGAAAQGPCAEQQEGAPDPCVTYREAAHSGGNSKPQCPMGTGHLLKIRPPTISVLKAVGGSAMHAGPPQPGGGEKHSPRLEQGSLYPPPAPPKTGTPPRRRGDGEPGPPRMERAPPPGRPAPLRVRRQRRRARARRGPRCSAERAIAVHGAARRQHSQCSRTQLQRRRGWACGKQKGACPLMPHRPRAGCSGRGLNSLKGARL